MSQLEVDKIIPQSGTTLTLGDSGDTINFGSGVLPNFENLTVTGDLTVDTNSLKVDSTNNRVGIGTASPSVSLDVVGAITATGNITGTLATAAQPNITSVGTLTGLTVSGNIAGTLTTAAQPNITSVGTLTSATISGDLNVANNIFFVDASASTVGLGTNSPNHKLELLGGSPAISIKSNNITNGSSNIIFGDTNDDDIGKIFYEHGTNSFRFLTNASERVRIDSSGNVGIGTSSPGAGLEVDNANGIKISRSGYSQYMQLYPANNNIPTILGVGGNGIHIGTTTTTGIQVDGSDNVLINTTSASGFDSAGLPLIVGSGSTHQGITIFSGTSHQGAIHFADGTGTSSYRGQLNYKHDADAMTFATSGSEKMRLNSTGLLGIGSTNPTTPIHINSNTPIITFEETDQSNRKFQIGSFGNAYAIYDATNTQYRYILDNSGNHIFNEGSQDCDFRVESNNNANMLFVDGGNDRVGIGTSSPQQPLHIQSDGGIRVERFAANSGSSNLDLRKSRNATIGSHTILQNGDSIGSIIFRGSDGTAFENAAAISAQVDGTPGVDDMPARLTFSTTADGTNSYTERMRITSAGLVGIGTSTPSEELEVSGVPNTIIKSKTTTSTALGGFEAHSSGGTSYIKIHQLGPSYGGTTFGGVTGNDQSLIEAQAASSLAFSTQGGTPDIIFAPARTARMTIKNGGNVGIGTASPSEKLEVNGIVKATAFQGDGSALTGVGGTNTPTFRAYLNSNINMNSSADTTAIFDTETFDPQSVYDTSNGRFTIPSGQAGKYFVGACIRCNINSTNNAMNLLKTMIFQYNSSNSLVQEINEIHNAAYTNQPTFGVSGIFNCSVGDYFLVKNYLNGTGYHMVAGSNATWFNAFKIIE